MGGWETRQLRWRGRRDRREVLGDGTGNSELRKGIGMSTEQPRSRGAEYRVLAGFRRGGGSERRSSTRESERQLEIHSAGEMGEQNSH